MLLKSRRHSVTMKRMTRREKEKKKFFLPFCVVPLNQRVWLPVKRRRRHIGTKEAVRAGIPWPLWDPHSSIYSFIWSAHPLHTDTRLCISTLHHGSVFIVLFGAFSTGDPLLTTTTTTTFSFRVSAVLHSNICQTSKQRDSLLCRSRGLTGSEEWPKSIGLGARSAVQR